MKFLPCSAASALGEMGFIIFAHLGRDS
jgi:hypothetical protein